MINDKEKEITKAAILVVDDDFDIRKLLKFKLEKIGYEVFLANNGMEAVEKARRYIPDLILLDMMMPVMNGLKACDNLKNHKDTKDIPIIFVTAVGDKKGIIAAYQLGADDYLIKPFDIIIMSARIKSIIETKRLEKAHNCEFDSKNISGAIFDFKHLFERLETEVELCREKSRPLSLLILDIDYMKIINAEYGFKVGDNVIKQVGKIVCSMFENVGTILQSNSDKLFIILPGVNREQIKVLVKRIFDKIGNIIIHNEATKNQASTLNGVSLSMGVVAWDKVINVSSTRLLDLIQIALKKAKELGRGKNVQYQFFKNPLQNGEYLIDTEISFHLSEDK